MNSILFNWVNTRSSDSLGTKKHDKKVAGFEFTETVVENVECSDCDV